MNSSQQSLKSALGARSVVLVGMMGVGKTTVGRRLAPKIGLPFVDSDAAIEDAAGMSVADLFTEHGEQSFRDGEVRVMKRLLEGPPQVIATGGGVVLREETRSLIRERSVSIWIRADTETIIKRATKRDTRPLLRTADPAATIRALLAERSALYGEADLQIHSDSGTHSQTIGEIMSALAKHLSNGMTNTGSQYND